MKRILFLFIAGILFTTIASAQPKTVTDYYLAMPSNLYNFNQVKDKVALIKDRKKNIKIEDIKNGYLRIESNDWEGFGEVALFKKGDGSYIIGQTEVGCGPICTGSVDFWTYQAGTWTNVTKQVLTFSKADLNKIFAERHVEESERAAYFELPRVGRKMKLKLGEGGEGDDVLAEFDWNSVRFVTY
ncbi:MAG: hypothetical protein K1X72_25800 [Pyrinomonadaceae bacterium]|nr:hypothetical protein [Pyrinomonadaceae bacterium]